MELRLTLPGATHQEAEAVMRAVLEGLTDGGSAVSGFQVAEAMQIDLT